MRFTCSALSTMLSLQGKAGRRSHSGAPRCWPAPAGKLRLSLGKAHRGARRGGAGRGSGARAGKPPPRRCPAPGSRQAPVPGWAPPTPQRRLPPNRPGPPPPAGAALPPVGGERAGRSSPAVGKASPRSHSVPRYGGDEGWGLLQHLPRPSRSGRRQHGKFWRRPGERCPKRVPSRPVPPQHRAARDALRSQHRARRARRAALRGRSRSCSVPAAGPPRSRRFPPRRAAAAAPSASPGGRSGSVPAPPLRSTPGLWAGRGGGERPRSDGGCRGASRGRTGSPGSRWGAPRPARERSVGTGDTPAARPLGNKDPPTGSPCGAAALCTLWQRRCSGSARGERALWAGGAPRQLKLLPTSSLSTPTGYTSKSRFGFFGGRCTTNQPLPHSSWGHTRVWGVWGFYS